MAGTIAVPDRAVDGCVPFLHPNRINGRADSRLGVLLLEPSGEARMKVYLAGTITADKATHEWRETAAHAFRMLGHHAFSPMREKNIKSFSADGLKSSEPPSLFVERDEQDIMACDAVLFYTLGIENLERQSIGTWAELGLARAYRKPIVVVADHPMVTEYPFIKKWAAIVVPTLVDGINRVHWLRRPDDSLYIVAEKV